MRKPFLILLGCILGHFLMAQKTWNTRDSVARGVSIVIASGISHYINTLQIDPSRTSIKQNFSCSSMRVMWEPEHRLSLGIEAGHYKVYEVRLTENNNINTASLSITPILFCVQMRVFRRFYVSAATGVSIHHADVNILGNQSSSQAWAFSNLKFSAGYVYPITKSFGLGLQAQFLSENKTEDMIASVQAVVRYQFKRRFKRVRERE
jgi:Lipid A 3-O-deacylase (PagL)